MMTVFHCPLGCVLFVLTVLSLTCLNSLTVVKGEDERRCQEITIPMCKGIGYNLTYMPNQFNHETQEEAGLEVRTTRILSSTAGGGGVTFHVKNMTHSYTSSIKNGPHSYILLVISTIFFNFYPFIYLLGEKDTPCENDTHSYTWRPEKYTPFQPHICLNLYNGSYPPPP